MLLYTFWNSQTSENRVVKPVTVIWIATWECSTKPTLPLIWVCPLPSETMRKFVQTLPFPSGPLRLPYHLEESQQVLRDQSVASDHVWGLRPGPIGTA